VRARRTERGAAAVEFALVIPIFLVLVFGVIQYGLYFFAMQTGTTAVGDATRRMSVGDCQTEAQVKSFIHSHLGSATTAGSASGITIVTRTYTKADGTGSVASPGEIGGTVTLTATFPTLNLNFPLIPVPGDGVVTRSATARVEDITASSVGAC
jgi:Flp pilus assembly protein TadG